MYVIIVGCGRVGGELATILSKEGHNVVVIDTDESRLKDLDPQFNGITLLGDGTDIDVLREAKIEAADVFVAATGDDNSNIMSAQIAKKIYNVPRTLVRVKDPKKIEVYEQFDLETVCATELAARTMAEMLRTKQSITILGSAGGNDELKVVEFRLPSWDACKFVTRLIKGGDFHICAVSGAGGKLSLKWAEEDLIPDALVVGCIPSDKLKVLGQIFEEKRG